MALTVDLAGMIKPILQERKLRVRSWLRQWVMKLGCLLSNLSSANYKLSDLRQVCLTTLSLSLPIYKMRIMIVATSQGCCEIPVR